MKKTLRIVLLLTLLCQYVIPVTTIAQENSSVNSSKYNDSYSWYSSFEESQKERTKETSVSQTDENYKVQVKNQV